MNDAHFLGYLRELDRESLPFLDKSQLYRAGELIGWQGVEKQYEKQLRYSKGVEYIEVDTFGREINRINENNIPAYPGNNLILSIDARLQQFSKNLLKENDARLDYAFVFENPAGAAHIFTYAFSF